MRETIDIALSPEEAANDSILRKEVASKVRVPVKSIRAVRVLRKSIDARSRNIKVLLKVELFIDEEPVSPPSITKEYPDVRNGKRVLIIGAGPAGLFAALRLIELGRKPIILERGKDVRNRRRDLARLTKEHFVHPDSNYCFGEGGAGTYSDGKLYTRSDKRGNVRRILETLVAHGANENILIEAHPHIGTNKLPQIITAIRESILKAGGEIHFESRVTDILLNGDSIIGITDHNGNRHEADKLILATGHSARDIFELLHNKQIEIQAKPFALGVRAEHPQELIDQIQYHRRNRGEHLPPASYSLVEQVEGKGCYSFCMCPGGIIAPCATNYGEVVTNGWSPSKRNNPFANSGIVVSVDQEDFKDFHQYGPLAGMYFQSSVEQRAWRLAGETQKAPAQRMIDFVEGKLSSSIPKTSYQPGVTSVELRSVLPLSIQSRLQKAFVGFGKKMRGYYTNEAVLVAPESRTSSPVRIPRNPVTLEHEQIKGLYPCGEGAGYAGGIVSAAIDGEKCAERCAEWVST